METEDGETLEGGTQTHVRRVGDRIRRSSSPWSPAVIALLQHLVETGFTASPQPVGSGFDTDGNELLSFIEGESPQPFAWSDDACACIGELLRDLHLATASFVPPGRPDWKDWYARSLGDRPKVIGHGDLGPWNIMAREGLPVGFIDWDYAGPIDPTYELAQVAWLNAQLHDDDLAERLGLPSAAARAKQVGLILDGYRASNQDRASLVDKMVEHAVHNARDEAVQRGITEASTSAVTDDGFPVLWSITWKIQSASWMLRNRRVIEAAIS